MSINSKTSSSRNLVGITTMFSGALLVSSLLACLSLSSSLVSADDSAVDVVEIKIPVSCSLTGTGMNTHTATINNGQYNSAIGTTTLKAFCNDDEGFAIYAIGYTDNEDGKNVLTDHNISNTNDIVTGTAISGNTSNWAMKLTATSGTFAPIIAGSSTDTMKAQGDPDFSTFQAVPSNYAKVAYRLSSTDLGTNAEGSVLTTTYQTYISPTQSAGTYNGQVKYTLVHPNDHAAPIANPATLDTGRTINSKLKSLAATVVNGTETPITPEFDPDGDYDWDNAYDEYVKSIVVHLETPAPSGFTPTSANTISTANSKKPVYIVFDNTNDAGIMHFYTEGEQIVLSPDSSFMFYMLNNLTTISGISNWDTSTVTDVSYMFYSAGKDATTFALDLSSWDVSSVTNMSFMLTFAGYSATTWSIGDLSSWDTSSVTNMSDMFLNNGYSATTWSIGDLSSWDTSSVTDMSRMFSVAGYSATTFSLDLSSWDISSVTSMSSMFSNAGYSATTWSIGDLSSWDTSSVTDMSDMFQYVGSSATTWSIGDLSSWDTSSVTDMSYMFANAGYSATTWSIGDLSSWDTSSVISMPGMFFTAGRSATTFSLDLSSWDTSSVTNMSDMFRSAGIQATTWSVTIPKTNNGTASGPIANTTSRLYGKTTSVYATPLSGKSFTLAQP